MSVHQQHATGGIDPIEQIATRVWQKRSALAQHFFQSGKWDQATFNRETALLAAPCILAGCSTQALPGDMAIELESLRNCLRFPGGTPFRRTEAEAREDLATDLASPLAWCKALGEATNRAEARWREEPSAENRADWMDLIHLSRALEVPMPWPIHPKRDEPERIAA